jgi:hypothetical protein
MLHSNTVIEHYERMLSAPPKLTSRLIFGDDADRCFGLVVAQTRRFIHHKSFFGDFCANDRSDIYLEFLPRPL